MIIVNREDFLKLPEGTVYSNYRTLGNIDGLFVKSSTVESGNDFLYDSLLDQPNSNSSGERFDLFEKAESDITFKFEMDLTYTGRDGKFDNTELYLVYDYNDVINLVRRLKSSIHTRYLKDIESK